MIVNEFINELKKTKYWNILLNKYNVIMVHTIGSNLTGLIDDDSDIDLLFVCDDAPPNGWENFLKFTYKGKPVHICYHNIQSYIYRTPNLSLDKVHGLTCQFMKNCPEHILYLKDGYEASLEYLLSLKEEISKVASKIFLCCGKHVVKDILQYGLTTEHKNKWLHHLSMCYSIIQETDLDTEFLVHLKRIRTKDISQEEEAYFLAQLKDIDKYISTLDIKMLQIDAARLNNQLKENF